MSLLALAKSIYYDNYNDFFAGCQPVGVTDPNRIPNAQMTASSYYSTEYYPYNARLNNGGVQEDGPRKLSEVLEQTGFKLIWLKFDLCVE